jgi:DNA-binding NtrC family response regulator
MQDKLTIQDNGTSGSARPGLKALLEQYERSLILEALAASGGHQRRTAARLGILPTTLHEKMKRLGLLRPKRPSISPEARLDAPAAAVMPMVAAPFGRR